MRPHDAMHHAQVLFAGVYIATQALVMVLYAKSEAVPPFLHVSLALSKRMHSIYVLRLFNDCWTMLFAYGALYLLMSRRVAASIAAFSVAVSTKMNVLLFAPGVLAVCLLVRVNPPAGSECVHSLLTSVCDVCIASVDCIDRNGHVLDLVTGDGMGGSGSLGGSAAPSSAA